MKFWKNIVNSLKPHNGIRENAPVPDKALLKAPGLSNPSQTSNQDVYAYDVKSWLPELHPNGMENSSYIEDIEFTNGKLDVKFRNGFKAEYDNIDPQKAREFATAPSKGRFFNQNIRGIPYKAV